MKYYITVKAGDFKGNAFLLTEAQLQYPLSCVLHFG